MKKLLFIILALVLGCASQPDTDIPTVKMGDTQIKLPKKVVLCQAPAFDDDINDRLVFRIKQQPEENLLWIDNGTGVVYFFGENIKHLIELAPFKLQICVTDIGGNTVCLSSKITKENFEYILYLYGRN